MSEPPETLKDKLYGDYRRGQNWRQRLYKQVCHKAVDIPDDDVNISTQSATGITWRELLAVGALALGGWWVFLHGAQTPARDSEYQVRFYDKNGELIEVPHISRRDAE